MMNKLLQLLWIVMIPAFHVAQIVDIESSTAGVAPPRVSNASALTCTASEVGSLVYQTSGNAGLYACNGTSWTLVGPSNVANGTTIGIVSGNGAPQGVGVIRYGLFGKTNQTVEANGSYPIPISGTLRDLYVQPTAALALGSQVTITLLKNGAATSLEVVIDAGTSTVQSNITDTVSVVAGDILTIRFAETGGASPGSIQFFATCQIN